MRYLRPLALLLVLLLAGSCTSDPPEPVRVGAIYPLSGTQGMGGIDEYHGVRVAAELVNADGGINGRPVVLDQVDVPEADAAPAAIRALADRGGDLVLGSYGSTISSPAAVAAARRGAPGGPSRAPARRPAARPGLAVLGDRGGGQAGRAGRRRPGVPGRPHRRPARPWGHPLRGRPARPQAPPQGVLAALRHRLGRRRVRPRGGRRRQSRAAPP